MARRHRRPRLQRPRGGGKHAGGRAASTAPPAAERHGPRGPPAPRAPLPPPGSEPGGAPGCALGCSVTETCPTGISGTLHVGDSQRRAARSSLHAGSRRSSAVTGCTPGSVRTDGAALADGHFHRPRSTRRRERAGEWDLERKRLPAVGRRLLADGADRLFCKHACTPSRSRTSRSAVRWLTVPVRRARRLRFHREGNVGAGGGGGAGGVWSGLRDGPLVQLRRREPALHFADARGDPFYKHANYLGHQAIRAVRPRSTVRAARHAAMALSNATGLSSTGRKASS